MAPSPDRITRRFKALGEEGRAGFVTFVTAGDPDYDTSLALVRGLPDAGADIIELGMPFTDPMADGPAIQASSLRALKAGASLARTLDLVHDFRQGDDGTPIVLMGYYNPIYIYGPERFIKDALDAGVDAVIVVDLPPEEDEELCIPALGAGLHFIRLATPTTDEARLGKVLTNSSGFIYYVSITGITGTKSFSTSTVTAAIGRLRRNTDLPIAVGFGIKTPDQAAEVARIADAVVVGSALVSRIADGDDAAAVLDYVGELAQSVRGARGGGRAASGGLRRVHGDRS